MCVCLNVCIYISLCYICMYLSNIYTNIFSSHGSRKFAKCVYVCITYVYIYAIYIHTYVVQPIAFEVQFSNLKNESIV